MTRIAPFPIITLGVLLVWLLVNQSLSLGHVLLGGAVALAGSWALTALQPPEGRLRKPGAILRLAGRVAADIFRSNVAVARIILGLARRSERRAGFVEIPLELRNPYGLAALACIITSTPGTLWVDFDPARGTLMIHVLDLIDDAEWVHTIKERYEQPLLEIFR